MKTVSTARRESARPAARRSAFRGVETLEDRKHFSVTVTGTAGNDVINITQTGVSFNITVNGVTTNTGNRPITNIIVNALGGNDTINLSAGITLPTFLNGGDGNDTIKGGRGVDTIDGGNGNDTLRGSDGNDILRGMAGNDTLYGGLGDDQLFGGQGDDYCDGEQGNDYIHGNGQPAQAMYDMKLYLNTATTTQFTAAQFTAAQFTTTTKTTATAKTTTASKATTGVHDPNLLSNGVYNVGTFFSDNDILRGNEGNDVIDGGGGNDVLYGDWGQDEIHGGDGDDRLYGGADNDRLFGGNGNDILVAIGGGTGDLLWGQAGFDSFWLDDARTTELVRDGETAEMAASNFHYVKEFEINLSGVGSQAAQQRPSKELLGQNLLDPVSPVGFANFSNRPLFGGQGPRGEDIRQGDAGDCYFLAGLSSVARANANRIRQSIVDLGDGTYAVQFYDNVQKKMVFHRVDGDLPVVNGQLKYAKLGNGNSTWVAIMEKAFAFHRFIDGGTYAGLDLGRSEETFVALALQWGDVYPAATAAGTLSAVQTFLSQGRAVIASSLNTSSLNGVEFIAKHQYVVQSVNTAAGTITVRNPWGYDGVSKLDANPNDGLATFTAAQFQSYFRWVTWAKA